MEKKAHEVHECPLSLSRSQNTTESLPIYRSVMSDSLRPRGL